MFSLFGRKKTQDNKVLRNMTPGYDSADYTHDMALYGLFADRKRPLFYRLYHAPLMMEDPRIRLGMEAACGVICSQSRFFVSEGDDDETPGDDEEGKESEIKKFVKKQITRWWRTSAEQMLSAMVYGWYSGEVMYKLDASGQIVFSHLKDIAPRDARPVVGKDGNLVGLVLNRGISGEVRADAAGEIYIGGMKKLWHVHQRQVNRWWGRSRLRGAWDPWIDLHDDNGLLDVRALAYYQHLIDSEVMYCQQGAHVDPRTGDETPYKQIARDMITQARGGAKFVFESNPDPVTKLEPWRFEKRERSSSVGDIKEAVEGLREEEIEGLGIPQEVIKAASTGSGFSGRRIPETAFHGLLQGVVFWMVHDFDEQVLRPLVRQRFNTEPEYDVIPFGLVEDEEEDDRAGGGDDSFNPGHNFQGGNRSMKMSDIDPSRKSAYVPITARRNAQIHIAV